MGVPPAVPSARRSWIIRSLLVGVAVLVMLGCVPVPVPAHATAPGGGVDTVPAQAHGTAGGAPTVTATVHTPSRPPEPEIVLLVDTARSMGGALTGVKNDLHVVIPRILLDHPTARFAVASYRSRGDGAEAFRILRGLTDDTAAVLSATDALTTAAPCPYYYPGDGDDGYPCDTSEDWLGGLQALGVALPTPAVAFNPGSSRIVVLIGDAPSQYGSGGATVVDAANALIETSIRVVAVTVAGGGDGLDATHQASAVVHDAGGALVSADPTLVSAAILANVRPGGVSVSRVGHSCDPGLGLAFGEAEITVTGGDDAVFHETVLISDEAQLGSTLHCAVRFRILGGPIDQEYAQQLAVHVDGGAAARATPLENDDELPGTPPPVERAPTPANPSPGPTPPAVKETAAVPQKPVSDDSWFWWWLDSCACISVGLIGAMTLKIAGVKVPIPRSWENGLGRLFGLHPD